MVSDHHRRRPFGYWRVPMAPGFLSLSLFRSAPHPMQVFSLPPRLLFPGPVSSTQLPVASTKAEGNQIKSRREKKKKRPDDQRIDYYSLFGVGLYGFPLFLFASLFLACLVMSVSLSTPKRKWNLFSLFIFFFPCFVLFLYFPFDLNNPRILGLYIFNYWELIHSLECVQLPLKKKKRLRFPFFLVLFSRRSLMHESETHKAAACHVWVPSLELCKLSYYLGQA